MKKHRPYRGRGEKEIQREGIIRHHGRFAFLLAETEDDADVFLSGRSLALAMEGDRVQASVRRESNGRFSGEIVRVVKRAHTSLVGILKQFPQGWAVFPEKVNTPPAQVINFSNGITPKAGDLAVLKITSWPTETSGAAGTVTEILGDPEDVHARITSLLRARGISESFPEEVLAQSSEFPLSLDPSKWRDREELFHLIVVTIDGADAKDFDDAVSLELMDGGIMRLGVHIADVAHYVKSGSELDKEAYERGTSVYLPDRVVPMLPPSLSENLCSLVPKQERLTMSVFIDIDNDGKVLRRRMANTVICSCRRFTYDEVQKVLDGAELSGLDKAVSDSVMHMGRLAEIMYRRRIKRGALDFDLPEYKVETDSGGNPLRVALRPRLQSHRLIEEFMLLANEAIATELMAAKAPFLHRRHDEPDPLKIKILAKALGELGLSAGHLVGGNTHKVIQDVLRQAQNHPLTGIINSLIVRSMKQAVYSPESEGHFGIAARAYAHFTSPIRRYPDLTAHRAIKALLAEKPENQDSRSLLKTGEHCSERERASAEAEHKAVDIMRAQLFKSNIGATMDGMVTTVLDCGSFVLCGDTGAEGLIRGTTLKPGTKVKVIIDAVDTTEGKINLSLAEATSTMPTNWRVRKNRKHYFRKNHL